MAFKINYEVEDQGVFENAYCMIDKITINIIQDETYEEDGDGNLRLKFKPRKVYKAAVRIYPDKGARDNLAYPLETKSFAFDWDNRNNIFKTAYNQIKNNDFFSKIYTEDC